MKNKIWLAINIKSEVLGAYPSSSKNEAIEYFDKHNIKYSNVEQWKIGTFMDLFEKIST